MIEKAIQIAVEAHKGQTDKAGKPYIFHVLRVMHAGKTNIEKICGVLHDVIEDTSWTFEQLATVGFSDEVIEVLRCVTKLSEDEDYEDFIGRIKQNPIAIKVKLNDLQDNMDITRFNELTEKDRVRLNKYLKAFSLLRKC
jgi:(p)ppGpp synthase/HD superfamily hydrolase